jgi:hypothetical protein
MQWVTRVQRALEENRLRLSWQEIRRTDGSEETTRHVELLLRMVDDDGSEILPMAFIPAAERYSIMPSLDSWVIEETLRLCQRYLATGASSIACCDQPVGRIAEGSGIPPHAAGACRRIPIWGLTCALKSPKRRPSATWPSSTNLSTPCAASAAALRWTISAAACRPSPI